MNILLIEDNRSVALALCQAVARDYTITVAQNGLSGLKTAASNSYDAIILDLNLPDISGLDVCRDLRGRGNDTPILVLSGEEKVMSKIRLLDAGANDYLTKPFSLGELKARLRVLIRDNVSAPSPKQRLQIDGLVLDPLRHQVERDGQPIELRKKEFALLECLMVHAGSVVTRTALGNFAWHTGESPWTNTIDVHIKHLRDKVDAPFDEQLIRTVHGLGYRLEIAKKQLINGEG